MASVGPILDYSKAAAATKEEARINVSGSSSASSRRHSSSRASMSSQKSNGTFDDRADDNGESSDSDLGMSHTKRSGCRTSERETKMMAFFEKHYELSMLRASPNSMQ